MTYSVDNWKKAMLTVMLDGKLRTKEEMFELAYQWLVGHNVLTEEEKDELARG